MASHDGRRGVRTRAAVGHIAAALLLVGTLCGCAPMSFLITPVAAPQALEEETVLRAGLLPRHKIALVDVDGVLSNERARGLLSPAGENPVALFTEKLQRAARDGAVKAVVLRINSPGGSVTASDLMYGELQSFRQRTGKPVIAAMLDVGASGGYYLACAADRIYAHPTTVTGSIGVMMLTPEFSGTMRKIGMDVNIIKSGPMKDAGSPFRAMKPEEREHFQGLIDTMYGRFLEVVGRGRPALAEEKLRTIADGRVYLGPEAKALGLIDELGTLHDAIHAARQAAGIERKAFRVVQYARPFEHRPNVYAQGDAPAQVNLVNIALPDLLTQGTPQFLYLWAPGWER